MKTFDRQLQRIVAWLLPSLLLLIAAGCEGYDDVAGDGQQNLTQGRGSGQTAYVKLRITIPHDGSDEQAGTRAAESHGTLNEYQVHSAYILLYKGAAGTAEDNLTCVKTIDLQTESSGIVQNDGYDLSKLFNADPSEHITTSGYLTLQLNSTTLGLDDNDHLYALILLNWVGVMDKSNITSAEGKSFSEFKETTISNLGSTEKGYFMSNVAMATKPGGQGNNPTGAEVVTIPEVKAIFTSESATEQDGKTVFVERVAAKLTVSIGNFDTALIIDNNEANRAKIHAMEWVVDNFNEKSYVLRRFDDSWLGLNNGSGYYPMVDSEEVKANYGDKQDSYRTLWGWDVNYSDKSAVASLNTYGTAALAFTSDNIHKNNETVFLHENTQSTNQREDATRVVVRMQLKDASKILLKSGYYGVGPKDGPITHICTSPYQLRKYLKKNGYDKPDLSFLAPDADGKVTTGDSEIDDNFTIYQYTANSGYPYVYYETFIRHFENPASDGLGRYGVVRNNSYTVNIGSISPLGKLGTPTYPAIDSGPIDQ